MMLLLLRFGVTEMALLREKWRSADASSVGNCKPTPAKINGKWYSGKRSISSKSYYEYEVEVPKAVGLQLSLSKC